MGFYLVIFLLLILILFGAVFWLFKIIKFYRQKRTKRATFHSIIFGLLTLLALWESRIIPLSADLDFRNQTIDLTGKQFWCWNDYRYNDFFGVRGEGFTFEIYNNLSDEMAKYFENPEVDFFEHFPSDKFETTKWRETPIADSDLIHFFTPVYGNWSKKLQRRIQEKQQIVKQVAGEEGSYFAVRQSHGVLAP